MKEYELGSDYFKNDLTKEKLLDLLQTKSPLQIANENKWKLEIVRQRMNYHKIVYQPDVLTEEDTRLRCAGIESLNWDNQGFLNQLKYGDPMLCASVIQHTKDHCLSTSKFTERVYRITNNFGREDVVRCSICKLPLKFYTMKLGYGYSEKNICKKCWPLSISFPDGYSKVSQELFWKIHEKLLPSQHVMFFELNKEYKVFIRKKDIDIFKGMNKHCYSVDFYCDGKTIEFDGEYWHRRAEIVKTDAIRDQYFEYRRIPLLRIKEAEYYKDPSVTVAKCLSFLTGEPHVATQSQ
jgi:very-short-patch-repair endonuclease